MRVKRTDEKTIQFCIATTSQKIAHNERILVILHSVNHIRQ